MHETRQTHFCHPIIALVAAAMGWVLLLPRAVWAQAPGEEAKGPEWVLNYALIVLCVGLGLAIICRPARRSKEIKVIEE